VYDPPQERRTISVRLEKDPDIVFIGARGNYPYGPYAYRWLYRSSETGRVYEILLDNQSWDIAQRSGWLIERVLNTAEFVIWNFLRDLCDEFTNIERIQITSLTRPVVPDVDDPYARGAAIDVGAISFTNFRLNFNYLKVSFARYVTQL
jgi:hypothetical protein